MQVEYYFIENGKSTGPYTKEALKVLGIKKDTLVWHQGITDWVKAEDIAELKELFEDNSAFGTYAQQAPEEPYFAMINGERVGPASIEELIVKGLQLDTPIWKNGMADWTSASNVEEVRLAIVNKKSESPHSVPPYYGAQNNYQQTSHGYNPGMNSNYGQNLGYQPQNQFNNTRHTNWLTWAIVGTIAGFLFSGCIGLIFGIIGIVQANKANSAYAMGDLATGNAANSSAKTMTIISLVVGGIGLLITLLYFGALITIFSAVANY